MKSNASTTNTGHVRELCAAMRKPEFYPEQPSPIEFKETHLSCVFLAGEYAYKFKKPVHFGFVDCRSLRSRYALCLNEVRFNRRLAPSVYLEVLPIRRHGSDFVLGSPEEGFDPEAYEYVVKTRRLPKEQMLDFLIKQGEVRDEQVRTLVKVLAPFHRQASKEKALYYGSPSSVRATVMGNLVECAQFTNYTVAADELDLLSTYVSDFVSTRWNLLDERARQGWVCEGHGDLRCEHVWFGDSTVEIIDCVEFSESLRYCDVAADVGFLAMDLDRLGAEGWSDRLVELYAREANDHGFGLVLNFYKCYRACVRGKVESLKSLEQEVPQPERELARLKAIEAFGLAMRYANRARRALLVVFGMTGSGKSTLAQRLHFRTGFRVLSTDMMRKKIVGVEPTSHEYRAPYGEGIYSEEFDRLTYRYLIDEARAALSQGFGVILDGTFKRRTYRDEARALANTLSVPSLFVECNACETEILRRLKEREHRPDSISDATTEIFLRQKQEFDPASELPAVNHIVVDTAQDRTSILKRIEDAFNAIFSHSGLTREVPG